MKVAELGSCSSGPVLNCCTRLGDTSYLLGNARQVAFSELKFPSVGMWKGLLVVKHFIGNFPLFPQSTQQLFEVGITIPSSQMRKLRHREVQ